MFKRIYIEITNICNMNCSFCKGTKRDKKIMDINDFETILKRIKGYTEYISLHVLGEPLIHPSLSQILELTYKYGFKVNLTTNGQLLDKNIEVINNAKSIRQINISLHSFKNIESIKELLNTVDKITLKCYISYRLWNLGVENNNNNILNILNEHYHTNINETNKSFKLKDNVYVDFESRFKWPDINDEERGTIGTCYGLRSHIGILVDGTVVPCCLDTDGVINLGNIFTDDLNSILDSEKCKQIMTGFLNRKLTEPLCKRCHYISRFNKEKK